MADYIYLLENRLSPAQRAAMEAVREVAKTKGFTVFLVGGAVRDLTSGSPVRDLDVAVQGNALKLKKDLEKAGATVAGEWELGQALYLWFPGGVRMEIGSTLATTYPKPGKPVFRPAPILEDLRRRDFTANAMALSLNEGSYGLLMDPLNGVADIENRELRLVSNYGFIEDPVRMVRAARLMARLGWQLEEKTATRYETGKQEEYISALSDFARGYETEEIVHEEDPLRVLKRLEAEGWMKYLAPYWTSAKVNVPELERLRDLQTQLQMQGIHPDPAAANFPLLTSKLSAADLKGLKASFVRPGFVSEIEALEGHAKELGTQLGSKAAAAPSASWKMLMAAQPDVVLWLAYSSKSGALQAKFKSFMGEWAQAKQKIPYALLQEMRIVPELPVYNEVLELLFFQLMDGNLSTTEEMKAFLEPYSPPAPPPPVNLRRLRAAAKKEAKAKGKVKKAADPLDDDDDDELDAVHLDDESGDTDLEDGDASEGSEGEDPDEDDEEEDEDEAPVAVKSRAKTAAVKPTAPVAAKTAPAVEAAVAPIVPVKASAVAAKKSASVKAVPVKAVTASPVKSAPVKSAPAKAAPLKSVPVKTSAVKTAPVKAVAKKVAAKSAPVAAKKAALPVKKTVSSAKKTVAKPAPAKTVVAAKKIVAKKTAPPAKKSAPAKVVAKKAVAPAKKAVAKKAASAKAVVAKGKKSAAPVKKKR